MPYTSNPFISKVRILAVQDVFSGMSYSPVGFKYGLRKELGRCATVIHKHMTNEGFKVSLSSVGRVLKERV